MGKVTVLDIHARGGSTGYLIENNSDLVVVEIFCVLHKQPLRLQGPRQRRRDHRLAGDQGQWRHG